ncbi:hypothetical protein [Pararhizobium gei]|uniref:hypothetical protein n=1 Tax=Pararhizobium gei TaxID=1395951 RepID=UPI0023DB5E1D|nr:hypothetical protein [Rhizobium gei]
MNDVLRSQIVEAIIDFPPDLAGNIPAVMADLLKRFPAATENDVFACFEEAIEGLRRRADAGLAEAAALDRLAPLFDGMPEGMTLGECALAKAKNGDPLALEYLQWEKQQAGGIQ